MPEASSFFLMFDSGFNPNYDNFLEEAIIKGCSCGGQNLYLVGKC